jgi:antitoxin ParD1/3/4
MNVSLTPELEQFIESKLKSGFYGSASEVIREGLRLLDEQDNIKKKRIEMLNLEIDKGLASLKAGRVIPGDEAYHQIVERRASYKQAE